MDSSMFAEKMTTVPDWVVDDLWGIRDLFPHSSRKNSQSEVDIQYNNPGGKPTIHEGWVTTTKYGSRRNDVVRLHIDSDVKRLLKRDFKLTYRRYHEKVLRGVNSPTIERDIPFWEFIDIEFDEDDFTFIFTPHYNLHDSEDSRFFPELGGGDGEPRSASPLESPQPEARPGTTTPRDSDSWESKKMAVESMDLREGESTRRFKWYRMPDGRKIHTKYSKWYDGDNHQYFWYGVTPKSLEIAGEVGLDAFGFITGREGCVVVGLETLLEYITEAQVSVEKEALSTIRHYHLFINRGMRLIHNRNDERVFESEFVPFD